MESNYNYPDNFDAENIDPTSVGDEDFADAESDNFDGDDMPPLDYDYSDDFDNATDD